MVKMLPRNNPHSLVKECLLIWLSAFFIGLPPPVSAAAPAQRISGDYSGNCFNPVISPDGTRVAYEVNYFERRIVELYIYDTRSKSTKQIRARQAGSSILNKKFNISPGGRQVTYELAWSPTRPDLYVFASTGQDENFELYLPAGGTLAPDPAADGMAAWSADGERIAFTSARSGDGDLYLIDINQTDQPPRQLTRWQDSTEWYPAWHPSKQTLAFVRHHARGGDNIYLLTDLQAPQTSLAALTSWSSIQTRPSWSPDGTRIAFYSNHEEKERYDLYVMDAKKGASPRLLLKGVILNERRGPTWTPDGNGLIIVRDDPEHFNPIRLLDVANPKRSKVLETGTQNNSDTHLVVTADGTILLAFTAQGRIGDDVKTFRRVYIYHPDPSELSFDGTPSKAP